MQRIKLALPPAFPFSTAISIRITDLNYGGHVGNDTVLSLIHEARVQFLQQSGIKELNPGGTGLIMSDVCIEFKRELFYGDSIKVSVVASGFSKVAFDLYYLLEKNDAGHVTTVAVAKTGMVCYDYQKKKVAAVPETMKQKLSGVDQG